MLYEEPNRCACCWFRACSFKSQSLFTFGGPSSFILPPFLHTAVGLANIVHFVSSAGVVTGHISAPPYPTSRDALPMIGSSSLFLLRPPSIDFAGCAVKSSVSLSFSSPLSLTHIRGQ